MDRAGTVAETDPAGDGYGRGLFWTKGPFEKLIRNVCEELHSESFRSVMYSGKSVTSWK